MNLSDIRIDGHALRSVIVLDYRFSHPLRDKLNHYLIVSVGFFATLSAIAYGIGYLPPEPLPITDAALTATPKLLGISLILISLYLIIFCVELYFRSVYYAERPGGNGPSFDVLKLLYSAEGSDVAEDFIFSQAGELILLRCGLTRSVYIEEFVNIRKTPVRDVVISDISANPFTLADLVRALMAGDPEFKTFLTARGVREADIIGATEWYMRDRALAKEEERWWSRERLSGVPSIGRDWSYSAAWTLQQYARPIVEHYGADAITQALKNAEEVAELERILSRAHGADAVVVGPSDDAAMDVVFNFARAIARGTVTHELEGKKLYALDYNIMASTLHTKAEYESALVALLNNAEKAKNIILVIPQFAAFLTHARSIGSDAVQILEPYFSSEHLQIIGVCALEQFQNIVEPNALVMSKMEKVEITEPSRTHMIPRLTRVASHIESRSRVLFTFGAIDEAITSAENYIPYGVMPDKAIDLLIGVAPVVEQQGKVFVGREDILSLVKSKTAIPVGTIEAPERAKLLSLEQYLHERVVGQDEAIKVIASALRRARAGVRNIQRPMGSALFLGPTGVGKTETVRALADLFFEGEKSILRFDMSEYQTADALEHLIGFSDGERVGTLTKALKDKPYGVLLLDEFEKASKNIHDLFLQILDEGFFSDMQGHRVSARNVIIIATSNAGSDLIWEAQEHGADMTATKSQIIDKLTERGSFKPELLNRFDAVVLFHALTSENLVQIARLMLGRLQARMRERNLELVITDDLVNAAVKFGTDKQFGARPMNRAIQEKIEQAIADKLIRGEIREGSQVIISSAELA